MWLLYTLACGGDPELRKPDDLDGDGFFVTEDCDDADPTAFPGGAELCDGVDNNCSGEADEGVGDPRYLDGDGDGFGAGEVAIFACTPQPGYADDADDCDDTLAAVNPAAIEVCDNLLDDDCDDSSGDCRESGVLEAANRAHSLGDPYGQWGTAVANAYGAVGSYSAALAVGVRDDVDDTYGLIVLFEGPFDAGPRLTTDLILVGAPADGTGQNVAWSWNDDTGAGVLLAGAPDGYRSGLWIAEGPFGSAEVSISLSDIGAFVSGEPNTDVGSAVAVDDLNGDGVADPITSDRSSGTVYVFTEPAGGVIADADVILEGDVGCGQALAVGDGTVDGLGLRLAIGCAELGSGRVYLVEGGTGLASGALAAGAARIDASTGTTEFGQSIGFGGWYTASDLFVGAPGGDGEVLVFDGHLAATSSGDADAQLTGAPGDGLGRSVAVADLDGDGPHDLVIGGTAVPPLVVYGGFIGRSGRALLLANGGAAELTGVSTPGAVATLRDNDAAPLIAVSDPTQNRAHVLRLGAL